MPESPSMLMLSAAQCARSDVQLMYKPSRSLCNAATYQLANAAGMTQPIKG